MIALYILLGILGLVIVLLAVCFIRAAMLSRRLPRRQSRQNPI